LSLQNVYDNQAFFEGYRSIRENKVNANILFEKPALFSLLPDMHNKSILDLGCGYGENCVEFVNRGAKHVVGIDISQKMLDIAKNENSDSKIEYKNLPMEDISLLDEDFDIVVSSLAVHYVRDFSGLVKNVYKLLNANGSFIFSQENPINTCFTSGTRWTKDADGNVLFANLSNYSFDGKRESTWFIDHVVKYHRTFSSIINTLIDAKFSIEKLLEPVPAKEIIEKYPEYKKNIHKPDFLLIKVKKSL
jgi:SAM-dependent methyltransferase